MFDLFRQQMTPQKEELDFWPNAGMNGYAFYHRVDKVNGGDMNYTHTTGFPKEDGFWYK